MANLANPREAPIKIPAATASFFHSVDREAVLELVELVLRRIPLQDLLLAQGVCKEWKQLIETSPSLQQALFFKPATDDIAIWHERCADTNDVRCVHLPGAPFFYTFPPTKATLNAVYGFEWSAKWLGNLLNPAAVHGLLSHTAIFLNPLLAAKFPWFSKFFESKTGAPVQYLNYQFGVKSMLPAACNREEASWRPMLITQPPLGALTANLIFPSAMPYAAYPGGLAPTYQHAHCLDLLSDTIYGAPIRMEMLQEKLLDLGMKFYGLKALEIKGVNHFREWHDGTDLLTVQRYHPEVSEKEATKEPGYHINEPFAPAQHVPFNGSIEDDTECCRDDPEEEAERDAFRGMLAYFMNRGK